MPRIFEKKLVAIKLRLFEEDLNALRRNYGNEFGVNQAIRTIVHSFLTQTQAKMDKSVDAADKGNLEPDQDIDISALDLDL